jgi:hypothetical protein
MFYDLSLCADPSSLTITQPFSSLSPTLALITGFVASPSGHWTKLTPPTAALISAAAYVRLPLLSRSLLPEWIYRVTSLQDAGLVFSYFLSADGPCPFPLRSADLIRHLGASFDLIPLSNFAFDQQIRLIRHSLLAPHLNPTLSPKGPLHV